MAYYLEQLLQNKLFLQHEKDLLNKFLKENGLENMLEQSISEWIDRNIPTKQELQDWQDENSDLEDTIGELQAEIVALKKKKLEVISSTTITRT
jgi:predicted  nucleic acid-binding Zn-ribbon protein